MRYTEEDFEQYIKNHRLKGDRITPKMIDETIVSSAYLQPYGTTLTVCILTLRNGFTVTGESACISPQNFDIAMGKTIAYENARNKIWALEGYLLKEMMHLRESVADSNPEFVNVNPSESAVKPESTSVLGGATNPPPDTKNTWGGALHAETTPSSSTPVTAPNAPSSSPREYSSDLSESLPVSQNVSGAELTRGTSGGETASTINAPTGQEVLGAVRTDPLVPRYADLEGHADMTVSVQDAASQKAMNIDPSAPTSPLEQVIMNPDSGSTEILEAVAKEEETQDAANKALGIDPDESTLSERAIDDPVVEPETGSSTPNPALSAEIYGMYIDEGRKAYKNGVFDNPYPPGQPADAWADGWTEERERSNPTQ